MYAQTAYPVINLVETGRCIERQRRQAGLTVRELQTYFGFEYPQAIYKWQHGECLPTVDNLLALSRILRVPMEDLLVYEDQGVSCFLGTRGRFPGLPDRLLEAWKTVLLRERIGPGNRPPVHDTRRGTTLPSICWSITRGIGSNS